MDAQMQSTAVAVEDRPVLFRVSRAAKLLDVSRSKAYELVASGELRSVRLGSMVRIPADAIDELVSRCAR